MFFQEDKPNFHEHSLQKLIIWAPVYSFFTFNSWYPLPPLNNVFQAEVLEKIDNFTSFYWSQKYYSRKVVSSVFFLVCNCCGMGFQDTCDILCSSPNTEWCRPSHSHVTTANVHWLTMFISLFLDKANYFRCYKQSFTWPLQIFTWCPV